jgi:hypothetical protein
VRKVRWWVLRWINASMRKIGHYDQPMANAAGDFSTIVLPWTARPHGPN